MESIQSVLLSVRQGDWMASIDLREAYLQVPVHPASRHFLHFMFRDTVYQFKALCFGLSTALQVFTWVMAPVSAILHSLGIRMRRYLDDWLVQSSSQESLLEDLPTVLRLCHKLGIVIHPRKSSLIPSQVVQYLWVVIDSTSFRASPSVERISRLRSRRCISVMRLAYREPVAVASRRSFLAGSPRSWRLTEDAVPPALPPSFLVPSGSGGSSVSVDDVSSRSPVLAPSTSSVSRGVSPPGVSWPTLLVRRLGSGLGRPSRLSGRSPACGTPNRQRCLSTPGNCSLFSWGFSSSGQLSKVAQWLSFATTPQRWLTFARRVAPGLLSSTPWLRRSCAGRSPSPSAWLHSSFRAQTTS